MVTKQYKVLADDGLTHIRTTGATSDDYLSDSTVHILTAYQSSRRTYDRL
jgi:hypothetical protein